ncbi:MAG: hypothetical protein QOD26_870 [Betaproteobacteria bacterium]|jgi:hypothetical protein|nr:hypothetical protein [Betaproteobacteria bacterium]
MTDIAKIVVAVAVLLPCHEAAAQTFKCTDAAGKVTYASSRCAELGLKDAGEVKERIQVTPAPPQPAPRPSPASAARASDTPKPPAAGKAESEDPDRRCFTVKTAKGSVTRCNDRPDDKAE